MGKEETDTNTSVDLSKQTADELKGKAEPISFTPAEILTACSPAGIWWVPSLPLIHQRFSHSLKQQFEGGSKGKTLL